MKKILGLTLVTLLGCGGDKGGTDTEAANSGGSTNDASVSSTNEPTTAAATGSATDNSGSGGETEGASTSTGSVSVTDGSGGGVTTGLTTGVTTLTTDATTDATTGGTGGDFMAECQAICDLGVSCMLDPGADCVMGCVDEFAGAMGECAAAIDVYLMCLANMTCMELIDLFDNGIEGPCAAAVDAANMACDMGGGDCTTGVGTNPQGTECSWTTECPDMPVQEMQCTKDQCVCLVDGVEMGTCPAEMVCKDANQLDLKASDCCGF